MTSSASSATLNEASPHNYSFLQSVREGRRGGGIASIFSDVFNCTATSFGNFQSFEYLAISLRSKSPTLVITLYRPLRQCPGFLYERSHFMSIILPTTFSCNLHIDNATDSKAIECYESLKQRKSDSACL